MVSDATAGPNQTEVVLVGCGCPLRGMGWYHAVQLLGDECPSAKLCFVVEPWFMGPGASGPGGPEFAEFQKKTEEEYGVRFLTSVGALPEKAEGVKRMALISGRTADNPRLLGECIKVRKMNDSFLLFFEKLLPNSCLININFFSHVSVLNHRLDVIPSILRNLVHQQLLNLRL